MSGFTIGFIATALSFICSWSATREYLDHLNEQRILYEQQFRYCNDDFESNTTTSAVPKTIRNNSNSNDSVDNCDVTDHLDFINMTLAHNRRQQNGNDNVNINLESFNSTCNSVQVLEPGGCDIDVKI
eukprot:Pgem_evm1s12600